MTPYRQRREQGHYTTDGQSTATTTASDLAGLGTAAPDLENLTKSDLIERAKAQGISPANAAMSKAELIAALEGNN